ncbi:MAG TPA: DUF4974 domain-containing protein [Paludibacteraceae bacterium]|nr:DUF4974 domain-containing protein [Paludibacteraceae bacterium]
MKKEEILQLFERYILNTASPDEVKKLCHWVNNNLEISNWLENQILHSSDEIDKELQLRMFKDIKSSLQIEKPIEMPTVELKELTRPSIQRFKTWMLVASFLIFPLISGLGVYLFMSNKKVSDPSIVSVERGQKASITLPDGSKVWLNSLSKLTYSSDFNLDKRELLLDGEAYFEVAKNPKKPFVVKSNEITVEALGTAFGIKAYSEDVRVSSILMHGKVRVTTPNGINILKPNERIQYDKIKRTTQQSTVTNAIDFTGWIHNELRFENESLDEIAKNVQRIYNVEIIFASEGLKKLRYTGTVDNNSLESVLNIITLTSPISYQMDKQKVILYENKSMMKHYNRHQ